MQTRQRRQGCSGNVTDLAEISRICWGYCGDGREVVEAVSISPMRRRRGCGKEVTRLAMCELASENAIGGIGPQNENMAMANSNTTAFVFSIP
jgi:hypothetical protein